MITVMFPKNTAPSNAFLFEENTYISLKSSLGREFEFVGPENTPAMYIQDMNSQNVLKFGFIAAPFNYGTLHYWLFRCSTPGFRHLSAKVFNA